MSTIQDPGKTSLVTGGLLMVWWRMPSLGPTVPLTCLTASSGGRGQSTAGLLSSGFHSILCSVSRPCCASELLAGKFSRSLSLFFFFPLWLFPQFGSLCRVSFLRLSTGHSGLVSALCKQPACLLVQPLLAAGVRECQVYLSAGNCS